MLNDIPQTVSTIYHKNCTWLDHSANTEFKTNLGKLITVQRNMRPLIKYKRFKRIVNSEQFARLWYHPNAGGGRRAKRRMLDGLGGWV
jgi:hypothetical protein